MTKPAKEHGCHARNDGPNDGKKPGENQDSKSNQGGEGSTGESDSANTENKGVAKGEKGSERRVPRAAGKSGTTLPPEFQKALDGYNKAAKAKK